MDETLTLLAAFVLGTLGVARATRLVTTDAYPPVEAIRIRWEIWHANRDIESTRPGTLGSLRHGWAPLLTCPFCFAPYAAAVSLAWCYASGAYSQFDGLTSSSGWWWALNVWAAVSYLSAAFVVRDEPPEED